MAPKDDEVEEYRQHQRNMDDELQVLATSSSNMDHALKDAKSKISTLHKELRSERGESIKKTKMLEAILREVELACLEPDTHKLTDVLRSIQNRISHRAGSSQDADVAGDDDSLRWEEAERQRLYMEHALSQLKQKAFKVDDRSRANVNRHVVENAQLIAELNDLRRENRDLKQTLKKHKGMGAYMSRAAARGDPSRQTTEQTEGTLKDGTGIAGTTLTRLDIERLLEQVEENNHEMEIQRAEIKRLRDKIATLMIERSGSPPRSPPRTPNVQTPRNNVPDRSPSPPKTAGDIRAQTPLKSVELSTDVCNY